MKTNFLIFLVCIFCIIGCKEQINDNLDPVFLISLNKTAADSIEWNKLVDTISYIPLETIKNCEIGKIEQIIVNKGLIYLVSDNLYCFDTSGRMKYLIKRGHAKNEFVRISSISVANDILCVYDQSKGKIMNYDAQSGEFLSSVNTSNKNRRVFMIEKNAFVTEPYYYSEMKDYRGKFSVCSVQSLSDSQVWYLPEKEHTFNISRTIRQYPEGIIYSSFLRNCAWKITDNRMTLYFKIAIPEEMRISATAIETSISSGDMPESQGVHGLSGVLENNQYIVGRLFYEKWPYYFFYDKQKDSTLFIKKVYNAEPWQYWPIELDASDENYFYKIVYPEEIRLLKTIYEIGHEPQCEHEFKAYNDFLKISEEDNPVIVQFHLRSLD